MNKLLWPVRNVAEYVYCPRLFYYMQVEGVTVPSHDTEKGLEVHRRVDRPSAASTIEAGQTSESECPKLVRSLALTSEVLGLTGVLDLAQITGNRAVPVEYRKGSSRRAAELSEEEAEASRGILSHASIWPTDRVQVALQAMLLESAGYVVEEAILYYAQENRRVHVRIDDALRAEALRALEGAKRCAQGERPLPLVNDGRCPRCSLQPVCLPDEVNYQRDIANGKQVTPRKIWPSRDDGVHIIAQQEGVKLGVRGAELRVSDRTGTTVKTVPLANVESVSLLGSVQITTQAIRALVDRNTPIAFLSPAGRLVAMIDPLDAVSAQVRRAQVRRFDCELACLEFARALVSAKIMNQRTLLLRNHRSLPKGVIKELALEAGEAKRSETLDQVRGHEGQAAAVYFAHFGGMIKGPLGQEFERNGRRRRPPPDPVNACLSLAYTMLAHECVAALRVARLEPSIGGFHVSRPGRPALALDIMEPFRPLIADSVTVSLFNRGELTQGHFWTSSGGSVMTNAGRKSFFGAMGRRMATEITHPVFEYRLSYRRMIVLHARMTAAWLMGEIESLAFLTTR